MIIHLKIDTTDGGGIPLHDRRILRAIANAGDADALDWQDPAPKTEASRKEALEHLADVVTGHAEELQRQEIQRQDDHRSHTHLAYDKGREEAQGDAQQAHPELHRAFAEENAAAAQQEEDEEGDEREEDEDTIGLPRHPDGRIVGRAPEGKKRRTKAQIAEDEAWEAAQGANEASDRAPVPDEEPEPPSAPIVAPQQQAPPVAQDTTEEPEQAAQPAPQEQEASSPWSW